MDWFGLTRSIRIKVARDALTWISQVNGHEVNLGEWGEMDEMKWMTVKTRYRDGTVTLEGTSSRDDTWIYLYSRAPSSNIAPLNNPFSLTWFPRLSFFLCSPGNSRRTNTNLPSSSPQQNNSLARVSCSLNFSRPGVIWQIRLNHTFVRLGLEIPDEPHISPRKHYMAKELAHFCLWYHNHNLK